MPPSVAPTGPLGTLVFGWAQCILYSNMLLGAMFGRIFGHILGATVGAILGRIFGAIVGNTLSHTLNVFVPIRYQEGG